MAIHISWRNCAAWALVAHTQQLSMSIITFLRNTLRRGAR
jgi:hypothetical protein